MAQAFAVMAGAEALSAGSRPSGVVNPKAIDAMRELGYDLDAHASESVDDLPEEEFEAVVTMGCGDACPWVSAKRHIDWAIPDPKDMEPAEFRKVRDMIGEKVRALLAES
jgi:protein-tyrosine-phosphatase